MVGEEEPFASVSAAATLCRCRCTNTCRGGANRNIPAAAGCRPFASCVPPSRDPGITRRVKRRGTLDSDSWRGAADVPMLTEVSRTNNSLGGLESMTVSSLLRVPSVELWFKCRPA